MDFDLIAKILIHQQMLFLTDGKQRIYHLAFLVKHYAHLRIQMKLSIRLRLVRRTIFSVTTVSQNTHLLILI